MYQEFDGLNRKGYIIERKENNGTGADELQTVFSQNKLNEKVAFFEKVKQLNFTFNDDVVDYRQGKKGERLTPEIQP